MLPLWQHALSRSEGKPEKKKETRSRSVEIPLLLVYLPPA